MNYARMQGDIDLLAALMSTEVLLVGDVENFSSHAAQCAFVTAAVLMARSGHVLRRITFSTTPLSHVVDVCVAFGDNRPSHDARHSIALNASESSANLGAPRGAPRPRVPPWSAEWRRSHRALVVATDPRSPREVRSSPC